jgi:hypothetical protein
VPQQHPGLSDVDNPHPPEHESEPMNPYLRARVEQYNQLRGQINTLQTRAHDAGRDLSADELREVTDVSTRARALYDDIAPYAEDEQRARAIGALAHELGGGGAVELGAQDHTRTAYEILGGADQVPPLMPSREQITTLYGAVAEQRAVRVEVTGEQLHTRAVVETADTGLPTAGLQTTGLREPRRIATAARLGVQQVAGVEGVSFPVFGAGAAEIAAESTTKTEYDAVTPGTGVPQVIAVWTDTTRQTLTSVTGFEARLRAKHAALVARREDRLMVARVLGTTGIQTHAAAASVPYADTLLRAAALVVDSDVAAEPDLALINPTDIAMVFGGATGRQGETPTEQLRLNLHGMTVYVTSAVAAGSAIVGAWSASSRLIVGMRPTMLVDAVSGLKNNLVTLLLEEAVTLAVDEPAGFVSVDLAP